MYAREQLTRGKWRYYDRDGHLHLCREAWRVIDRALEHKKVRSHYAVMTPALQLLSMLRDGPVFQSELMHVGNPHTTLSNLRHFYLQESGLRVIGNWCCVLAHGHFLRSTERVYQLERSE